jgi:hypothetical protein
MTLRPSIIPAGNVALRGFEQDGIYHQSAGIQSYYQLVSNAFIAANGAGVTFLLPNSLELISLWASSVNNPINLETDIISLTINDTNNNYQNTLDLSASKVGINNFWIAWEFPKLILEKDITVSVSASFDINFLRIFAQPCHMANTIVK